MSDRPRTATALPPAACAISLPPPPPTAEEAVARLQAHLVLYARLARAWGPELRACLDALEPFLPPAAEREVLLEGSSELPFALALFGEVECLLADGLSPMIAGFEAAGRSLPGEAPAEPVSAAVVWREIDPKAPAAPEGGA